MTAESALPGEGFWTPLTDRYQLEREIGSGGMATVWLAQDIKHRRRVAIKVLHPELSVVLGPDRFLKEIELTAGLQHPHILPLFDSGSSGGQLFYVMPYVEGETLRTRLERETQLPIPDAVRIVTEVASALDYAHRHGVIHRDIKPENILVHDGRALVADFGIALAVEHAGGKRMTQTGLSLGTPQYMSPEQATGEREITARSDVYSLGAVTYEMLAGEPPFTGPSAQAIVAKVVTATPEPLIKRRPTVPPEIDDAVLTALQKLPADRFATAAEFASALEGEGLTRHPTRGVRRNGGLKHDATLWRRVALVSAAAAVALAAIASWSWLRRGVGARAPVQLSFVSPPEAPLSPIGRTFPVSISPDGSFLAYVGWPGMSADSRALYVRRMSDGVVTKLPGTELADSPFFSPDGRWLAFHRGGVIYKVPLSGGAPIKLADSAFQGGAWSSDGRVVYTSSGYHLRAAPSGGGASVALLPADTVNQRGPWLVSPLPDGKGILFRSCTTMSPESCTLHVLRADGGVKHLGISAIRGWYLPTGQLAYAQANGAIVGVPFDLGKLEARGDPVPLLDPVALTRDDGPQLTFSASGTLAYVTGNYGEVGVIVEATDEKVGRQVTSRNAIYRRLRVSPDGQQIAFQVGTGGGLGQLWIMGLRSGGLRRLVDARYMRDLAWSPNGDRLAVIAGPGAGHRYVGNLFIIAADGSDTLRAVAGMPPAAELEDVDWSADGRWLVVTDEAAGREGVYLVPADGSGQPRLLIPTSPQEPGVAVSPDGRWLAYVSNEGGQDDIFVRPFLRNGVGEAITTRGGDSPVWRRDGRALYYTQRDSLHVAELSFAPAPFIRTDKLLASLSSALQACRCYDALPDGKGLLVVRRTFTSAPVTIVLNWFEDVKKRMRAAGQ